MYIIGQVVPLLNPPEDLKNYQLKSDEVKFIKPKYDPVSGLFLGLIKSLDYLTVRSDEQEHFLTMGLIKKIVRSYTAHTK